MAYLKTVQKIKRKSTYHEQTPMRELRQQAYQNSGWRKTREQYLRLNPLCQECLKLGKVTAADSVHHKESPFKGGQINWELLFDFNNLEAICHECHGLLHTKGEVEDPEALYNKIKNLLPDDNQTDNK